MILNDRCNIKDIASCIAAESRKNNCEPSTIKAFFTEILKDIPSEFELNEETSTKKKQTAKETESKTIRVDVTCMQKACSGQLSNRGAGVQEIILDRICNGEFRTTFERNVAGLANKILKNCGEDVFRTIGAAMDPRFFSEQEFTTLNELLFQKQYGNFFLCMLRHALGNLNQIPTFAGETLHEQSLVMYASKYRIAVEREAANLGNNQAAFSYAGRVKNGSSDNPEGVDAYAEALRIYLAASATYRPALWNVAYYLDQQDWIRSPNDRQLAIKTVRIDDRLSLEARERLAWFEPGKVDDPETTMFCFKVFYFLATNLVPFQKAATNLANMLERKKVLVKATAPTTLEDELQRFYGLATKGGDLLGTLNFGIHEAKKVVAAGDDFSDFELKRVRELLRIGKQCDHKISIFYYALMEESLIASGKAELTLDQIRQQYLSVLNAEKNNYQGRAAMRLAMLETDNKQKKRYLDQAFSGGENGAAYRIAMMTYEEALRGKLDPADLIHAISILESQMHLLDDDTRHDAEILLRNLKKLHENIIL